MSQLPAITGKQLIGLLKKGGWKEVRFAPHGVFFRKGQRSTTVQNTSASLPKRTLQDILSVHQTGLGSKGLLDLIRKHG